MRKRQYLLFALAGTLAFASCSKLGSLSSDNFTVTPTPLETVGGQVPVTINGTFPEKYMKKKAVVTATPMLKYQNGQSTAQSATFQGEKVEGNDQTISYKVGGHYTMKSNFKYVPDMDKSDLYMHFDAKIGKRKVTVPDVKIGYGVVSTSELLGRTLASANAAQAPDSYQRIIKQRQEANIKFLIEQAKLRNSELKSTSVKQFTQTLRDIKNDTKGREIENVDVSAYASPDGPMKLNTKLAEQRQNTSAQYAKQQMKSTKVTAPVDTKYTAEDWDGFKELVEGSNIQDKDLILRVLSMYQDPQERERQIRNISTVYKDLADEILPQLRRSRLAINYNLIGRSDDEIQDAFKQDASKLSNEELIYGANNLVTSSADRKAWYQRTAELYPNDYRAYNNLAQMAYSEGNTAEAQTYLDKARAVNANAPEVNTNLALLALSKGDAANAETYLAKGYGANSFNEVMGCLNIAKGNYAQAATNMNAAANSNSAALAYILNKDYASASSTLDKIKNADATTSYLKAIVAARTNNESGVSENLRAAVGKDASLARRAANDLEFAKFASVVSSIVR
jgi:outer membrane protein OmpA-like peptidoglycan-associated protein